MAFEDQSLFGGPITRAYFQRKGSAPVPQAQIGYAQLLKDRMSAPMASGSDAVYGGELAARQRLRGDVGTGLASAIAKSKAVAEAANMAVAAEQGVNRRRSEREFREGLGRIDERVFAEMTKVPGKAIRTVGVLDKEAREETGKGIFELVGEQIASDEEKMRANAEAIEDKYIEDVLRRSGPEGTTWWPGKGTRATRPGRGLVNLHQETTRGPPAPRLPPEAPIPLAPPEPLTKEDFRQFDPGPGIGPKMVSVGDIPDDATLLAAAKEQGFDEATIKELLIEAQMARAAVGDTGRLEGRVGSVFNRPGQGGRNPFSVPAAMGPYFKETLAQELSNRREFEETQKHARPPARDPNLPRRDPRRLGITETDIFRHLMETTGGDFNASYNQAKAYLSAIEGRTM